ncbi:MAG: hypothetical protein H7306_18885 [Bacteriovorax sp.]|nr:hypothetical protein [Rhizobacter sp.]
MQRLGFEYGDWLRPSNGSMPAAEACPVGSSATHGGNEGVPQRRSWFTHRNAEILMKSIWKNTFIARQVTDRMALRNGAKGLS